MCVIYIYIKSAAPEIFFFDIQFNLISFSDGRASVKRAWLNIKIMLVKDPRSCLKSLDSRNEGEKWKNV